MRFVICSSNSFRLSVPTFVKSAARVAAVKKNFEGLDQDTVTFYQQLPEEFYQAVVQLSAADLTKVGTESLKLLDEITIPASNK
jgi:hypothetical protein